MKGRGWATAGFLLGISLSVAANVAHAYLVADGRPPVGAQIAGAAFPVVLLVTVEILSRVQWPATWGWAAARYGGAGVVAAVAAIVSYGHMAGVLTAYSEDALTAAIGPLAIDGLMVVSSMALLAIGRTTPEPVAAGGHEVLPTGRPGVEASRLREASEAATADHVEVGLNMVATTGPVPLAVEGPQVTWPSKTGRPDDQGEHEQLVIAGAPEGDPALGPLVATARDRFAEVIATGSVPSTRAIRRELRIGHPKAARVKELLGATGDAV